jgi:succinate dehydrogenase/fumarate reductase-like Fe-S protein
MEINGWPWLACMTRMSVFTPSETLIITPLRTFPVIRDLVTDVSFNYAKAREIPSLTPDPSVKPGEPGMATLPAVAVFLRKVEPASRRLTSARSVEPSVP